MREKLASGQFETSSNEGRNGSFSATPQDHNLAEMTKSFSELE